MSGLLPRRIEYGLEGDEKTITRCTPDGNADGYNEYYVPEVLSERHPYLESASYKVQPQEVCIGYQHRSWSRLAQQLRELPFFTTEEGDGAEGAGGGGSHDTSKTYTVPDHMVGPINLVLETIAIESSDPEFSVSLANEFPDFTGLFHTKTLQLNCAKVTEQMSFHMYGRKWLSSNLVPVKLAEIITAYAKNLTGDGEERDEERDEEMRILYSIGKALHRWTLARDGLPSLQSVQNAVVLLLCKLTFKKSPSALEYLTVLEMTHALKALAANNPTPVLQSELISHLTRFMELVYTNGAPNKDFILEACLSILTQAGNAAEGRNQLLANDAETICSRLVFESSASRVQDAATGACSVISLHKDGKARLEVFLLHNNFEAFVKQLALFCTSQKLKFVQSLSAKPSFRISFLREAIRLDKHSLIKNVFGVAAIPTAYLLLEEFSQDTDLNFAEKVITVLEEFLSAENDPSGGADYISLGIRFGLPVISPSQIAYENCVDIVTRLADYYPKFSLKVMSCFRVLYRDEERFKPVFRVVAEQKSNSPVGNEIKKILQ